MVSMVYNGIFKQIFQKEEFQTISETKEALAQDLKFNLYFKSVFYLHRFLYKLF
jgi:hypothetical protein